MTLEEIAAQNNGLIVGAVMSGHFYSPKAFRYFDAVSTKDALTGYVRGVLATPDIVIAGAEQMLDGTAQGLHVTPDVRVVDAVEVTDDAK